MKTILKAIPTLLVTLLLFLPAGCAAEKSANSAAQNARMNAVNGVNQAASQKQASSAGASSSLSTNTSVKQSQSSRKIIMNADLSLQTSTYDKTLSGVETLVTQYGGFIQNSVNEGTGKADSPLRTASYTIRIPSDKLNAFTGSVGDIGKVVKKTVKGEDVTQDYFDTEARLTTLKAEQARILDILSKTQNMSDVLSVEQRLTDVETQIEQLTGELQKWDSLVDLSTVTLEIREVKDVSASTSGNFGSQALAVIHGSLNALRLTLQYVLIGILALLPFAAVAAVIIVCVLFIRRTIRKKRRAR